MFFNSDKTTKEGAMTNYSFSERQSAFHEAVRSFMKCRPESFVRMQQPTIDLVTESVGLGGSFFECCLPGRAAVFVGMVTETEDGALVARLTSVSIGGEGIFP